MRDGRLVANLGESWGVGSNVDVGLGDAVVFARLAPRGVGASSSLLSSIVSGLAVLETELDALRGLLIVDAQALIFAPAADLEERLSSGRWAGDSCGSRTPGDEFIGWCGLATEALLKILGVSGRAASALSAFSR